VIITLLRDKFTALQNNPVWITGESFSGIFVPQITLKMDGFIAQTKKDNPAAWVPNLKGLIVGNALTDFKFDGKPGFVPSAYYFGLVDDELYEFIMNNCDLSYLMVRGYSGLS
jgi:Serine carboxypeptidase